MNLYVTYHRYMDNMSAAAISCKAAAARQARDIIVDNEPALNSRYSSEKRGAADKIIIAYDVLRQLINASGLFDARAFQANNDDVVSPAQTWLDVQSLRTFYNAPETQESIRRAKEVRRIAEDCDSAAEDMLRARLEWGVKDVDDPAEVAVIRALVYCLDVDLVRLVNADLDRQHIDLGDMGAHCNDGGLRSYLTDARVLADDADVVGDGMVAGAWVRKLESASESVLRCADYTIYKRIEDGELYYLNDDNVA